MPLSSHPVPVSSPSQVFKRDGFHVLSLLLHFHWTLNTWLSDFSHDLKHRAVSARIPLLHPVGTHWFSQPPLNHSTSFFPWHSWPRLSSSSFYLSGNFSPFSFSFVNPFDMDVSPVPALSPTSSSVLPIHTLPRWLYLLPKSQLTFWNVRTPKSTLLPQGGPCVTDWTNQLWTSHRHLNLSTDKTEPKIFTSKTHSFMFPSQ